MIKPSPPGRCPDCGARLRTPPRQALELNAGAIAIDRVAVLEHANRALSRGIKILRAKLDRADAEHRAARAELAAQRKRRGEPPPSTPLTPEQEAGRRRKKADFAERLAAAADKVDPPVGTVETKPGSFVHYDPRPGTLEPDDDGGSER